MAVDDREDTVQTSAGHMGMQVIGSGGIRELDDGAEASGRWEERDDALEADEAWIGAGGQHFAGLSMRIARGQHTLVVGGSRERRAALAAALTGGGAQQLWGGVIRSPAAHRGVAHVGGRAYVRAGSTLWDLLVFPHDKARALRRGVAERQLAALLGHLGFGFLLELVHDDWAMSIDWAKVLGARDLAALALCRLLYHAPAFALVDDAALAALAPANVQSLFAAANHHRITIVVLAAADPFEPHISASLDSRNANHSETHGSAGFLASIGEFSRALRLREGNAWQFCAFGYGSAERVAFDAGAEPTWVWALHDTAALGSKADGEYRSRLQRRASTLSQCSTTERRWLVTPEYPLSPVHADRGSRRHSSRLVSPVLSPRSSVSDLGAATTLDISSLGSRLRRVDSVLSSLSASRQPTPPPAAAGPGASAVPAIEEHPTEEPLPCDDTVFATPESTPAPADAPAENSKSSAESDRSAEECDAASLARPRNYRRSTRPGMGLSPRTAPKPMAAALSFIPPVASHDERPRSRRYSRAAADMTLAASGNVSEGSAVSASTPSNRSSALISEDAAPAAALLKSSVTPVPPDACGQLPAERRPSAHLPAASPSRIPRPRSSVPAHRHAHSPSTSSARSYSSAIASSSSSAVSVATSADRRTRNPIRPIQLPTPVDELTAALENL
ncbi:ATP-binding cassette long-chain fatty acid transporter pxa2 [Coemansia guatemalensis]|uniref:ATP-binding cassette long-chain fatty acid transporter pxa2 n=1 Tax=Coemansia guatemalensis TaxID=2761395 RepID=A0A9W8HZL5_9FUNG|nr:ATP-binding cassette long-chain fatty acid transporter pxa2 [Coemansia guatemalensis]